MKPTIGIIGGCGPLATIDIEQKILKLTKELLHPLIDQDYFNMLVFNYTQFYDRNDAIASKYTLLFDDYLRCARSLISVGIDILLIACQTAHVYLSDLKKYTNIPIIDIVQETAMSIYDSFPGISKLGLLSTEATQKQNLYQKVLTPYNIKLITVSSEVQKGIMEAIYIIKSGINLGNKETLLFNADFSTINKEKQSELENHPYKKVLIKKFLANPITLIKEACNYLASEGCTQVILGCTELPLILPYINAEEMKVELIDPNSIVAKAAVVLAKNYLNKNDK